MEDIKLTYSVDIVVCGDRGQYCSRECPHFQTYANSNLDQTNCSQFGNMSLYKEYHGKDIGKYNRLSKCHRLFENQLRERLQKPL